MKIEKNVPVTFTVTEVSKILGCSRSLAYVLVKSRELGSVSMRGARRVTQDQLVAYIKRLEEEASRK